ncbi:MAG TPA: hypothetical protein VK943_11745 [Arenibaculum sp.]|nr:hypothetical protein [Arenibaculum sp.]
MTTKPEIARDVAATEFARLGVGRLAYVRPSVVNGRVGYTINAADGSFLGSMWNRDEAVAECRLHDLEPVVVH